jgi:hypothetical protein
MGTCFVLKLLLCRRIWEMLLENYFTVLKTSYQ